GDLSLTKTGFQSNVRYRISAIDNTEGYISLDDGEIFRVTGNSEWQSAAKVDHFLSCGYHLTTEAHICARPAPVPSVFPHKTSCYLAVPDFSNHIQLFRAGRQGSLDPI